MKNITLILFFFFFLTTAISQSKNIYVSYKVEVQDEKEMFKTNQGLRAMLDYAINNDSDFSFGLIIKKDESKFYQETKLIADGNAGYAKGALAMMSYIGDVYTLGDFCFKQNPLLGNNTYTKIDLKSNWNLVNETKLIDGYLCYKATNIKRVDNVDKVFNHPVIAWFCPKLPYKVGPNGYGNLPGLILELQVRNVVYSVKKVTVDTELNFDTDFLKKAKILSQSELESEYKKFNEY